MKHVAFHRIRVWLNLSVWEVMEKQMVEGIPRNIRSQPINAMYWVSSITYASSRTWAAMEISKVQCTAACWPGLIIKYYKFDSRKLPLIIWGLRTWGHESAEVSEDMVPWGMYIYIYIYKYMEELYWFIGGGVLSCIDAFAASSLQVKKHVCNCIDIICTHICTVMEWL